MKSIIHTEAETGNNFFPKHIKDKWEPQIQRWMQNWPDKNIILESGLGTKEWSFDYTPEIYHIRSYFNLKYSFAIPCREALDLICKYSSILEVGCGSGFWAYLLRKRHCKIIATDHCEITDKNHFNINYTEIEKIDAVAAVRKYPLQNVFMCWPSYMGKWAAEVLHSMRGEFFIYIGENKEGCCADETFFKILENYFDVVERYYIPVFYGLYDYLTIYRRK